MVQLSLQICPLKTYNFYESDRIPHVTATFYPNITIQHSKYVLFYKINCLIYDWPV